MDRKDVARWLEGPGSNGRADYHSYPGHRLGLPESGPGSIAGVGRRIVAISLDWWACALISTRFHITANEQSLAVLGLFWAECTVLVAFNGASFGQRICGIGVRRLDGRRLDIIRAAMRNLLICAVVPAMVWNRDHRGLHDRAVGSVVIRVMR